MATGQDVLDGLVVETDHVLSESSIAEATQDPSDTSEDSNQGDPLAGTKFAGKSPEEMWDMYRNLETAFGRQSNDLGVQRRLTDQLLGFQQQQAPQGQAANGSSPQRQEVDPVKLLDNPTEALDAYFNERKREIEEVTSEKLRAIEATLNEQQLRARHPDLDQLYNDDEFVKWIQASPLRTNAAQYALQGDLNQADALLTEYKAQRDSAQAQTVSRDAAALNRAESLGLDSATRSTAESGANKKKVYSRAKLMELRAQRHPLMDDPDFQEELLVAYNEGRVR